MWLRMTAAYARNHGIVLSVSHACKNFHISTSILRKEIVLHLNWGRNEAIKFNNYEIIFLLIIIIEYFRCIIELRYTWILFKNCID